MICNTIRVKNMITIRKEYYHPPPTIFLILKRTIMNNLL